MDNPLNFYIWSAIYVCLHLSMPRNRPHHHHIHHRLNMTSPFKTKYFFCHTFPLHHFTIRILTRSICLLPPLRFVTNDDLILFDGFSHHTVKFDIFSWAHLIQNSLHPVAFMLFLWMGCKLLQTVFDFVQKAKVNLKLMYFTKEWSCFFRDFVSEKPFIFSCPS